MTDKPSPNRAKSRRSSVESSAIKAIALKCFPGMLDVAVSPRVVEKEKPKFAPNSEHNDAIFRSIKASWKDSDLKQSFEASVSRFSIK